MCLKLAYIYVYIYICNGGEDSELNWSIENSLGEMTDRIFIEKSILGILTTLNRIKEQIANIVIMSNGDFSGLREIIADKID